MKRCALEHSLNRSKAKSGDIRSDSADRLWSLARSPYSLIRLIRSRVDLYRTVFHAKLVFGRRLPLIIPTDLRTRLETARLDLLALFRALDQINLTPLEIPQRLLRQLFEFDADYAEGLWALDQPEGILDMRAMLRDTLAALEQLTDAATRFRKHLPRRAHPILLKLEPATRQSLSPAEAYNMIPGREPHNG